MTIKEKISNIVATLSAETSVEETKVELATATLEDGTPVEANSFEEGQTLFIVSDEDRIPAPAGEHKSDVGTIVVGEEGVIVEVREEEAADESAEEVEEDAAPAEEQAELTEEVAEPVQEELAEDGAEEPAEEVAEEEGEEPAYVSKEEFDAQGQRIAALEEQLAMLVDAMSAPAEAEEVAEEDAELSAVVVEETVEVDLSAAATPITQKADVVEMSQEVERPSGMSDREWRYEQALRNSGLK